VGNAYVTGESQGYIFLAKYDGFGNSLWTRQTGLSGFALASGVAVDREGNAYITGYTDGDLGGPNVDPTHNTMDFFLAKYDASGSRLWMRQAGSMATDKAYGVAVDAAGNAYLAGGTNGNLGGPNSGVGDIFAAKYDGSGSQLWLRHIGSARDDRASSLAVDGAGNMYIVGDTAGDLGGPNAGPENTYDIFVAKYDPSGNQLWLRQIGSAGDDRALAAAVDGEGSVFVTGASNGNLVGFNAGGLDIILIKYDSSGTLRWMQQAGSAANDVARGVAVDGADHVYLAGFTLGDFGGLSAGGDDIFVAKYGPPSCASIADVAGGLGGPDGVVDGSDFVAFINSFGIGDWATDALADVNGDGMIDGSDLIAFINAFAAGC
jgi:hypothetical protein